MTSQNLLNFFENYYGEKYSGVFQAAILEYLSDASPSFLKAAAEVVTKRYSRSFGKSPDIAVIELHFDEIIATMPKPKMLPEPIPERCAPEVHDKFIKDITNIFKTSKKGAMGEKFESMVGSL